MTLPFQQTNHGFWHHHHPLNYFFASPDGSRPYTDIHTATGKPASNWIEDLHDMQVEDVCGKEELYKLDNTGSQYGREVAKHTSFLNDDEIEREYSSESIDQTPATSIARVHRHLPPTEAPSILRRRFQITNL
ncbi:hypothetical protein EV424DRAFT_1542367 [Suillus variegatus]|nr:hypothetical protein EV424DRAFT_1542367 [Suillus variegatus]